MSDAQIGVQRTIREKFRLAWMANRGSLRTSLDNTHAQLLNEPIVVTSISLNQGRGHAFTLIYEPLRSLLSFLFLTALT